MNLRPILTAALVAVCGLARAEEPKGHTGTQQSSRLYTPPDPSSKGGIRMKLVKPNGGPVVGAFALLQFETKYCYRAAVNGDTLTFSGLPAGKYDLLILCEGGFFEGLKLNREDDSLAKDDKASIEAAIMKSVQFFDTKKIHRLAGAPGDSGVARAMLQEMRLKPVTLQDASVRSDIQIRSLKLVVLEDVGPAWQLTTTREISRQEVAGNERRGLLPQKFVPALSGIRVTDQERDLGPVDLGTL